jgi:RecA/RadA recombinase
LTNKFAAKLRRLENVVTERFDVWAPDNLLYSSSPGLNWLFGKNHGIPLGYTLLSWGEQKAGKSVLFYDLVGQMHQRWPDALAIKFDTEFRDDGQLDEKMAKAYGIDLDRLLVFQTNKPEEVFDVVNGDIATIIQDGGNVKLMGIDSLSCLMGRRTAEQKSVKNFQIGDHAMTMQIGLQSMRSMLFKKRILLYLTAHARDEMDTAEQMRGNKKKPAAAMAVKHLCEFVINVEKNVTKTGNVDELENKLIDETKLDMSEGKDNAERTGHKIRFWMQGNTLGPANRQAETTFDYSKGFVNQHEEIFRMGNGWGVIERVNKLTYKIGSETFSGKPAILAALAARKDLQQIVLKGLLEREKTVGSLEISAIQAEQAFDNQEPEDE